MKTALYTILLMTSFSGIALAADKVDKSKDFNSGTYAVERMICSKIYVPATGAQSPTYRAGIDAQGNPVAPADLNSVADNAPDYTEVPMTIDLARRMNVAPVGAEAQLPVANLKLYKDGRVEYNGQDISSNASSLCGFAKRSDVSKSSPAPAHMIEPAAGQEQMLAAPSETVQPDTRNDYQSDSVAPDNLEPQAGSVAPSATSTPPPKVPLQIQRSTVNMAPRTTH